MIKPSKRTAAKRRAEKKVADVVRAACVERDGYCRLRREFPLDYLIRASLFTCYGPSEWAHLGDKKRFKTRKMAPHERHTTAGSAMLCATHHRRYDRGELTIQPLSERGADGPLSFSVTREDWQDSL